MPSEFIINLANVLQASVPFLSLCAYVPQWKQLVDTKSSRDISLIAWTIWIFSSSFALFYAVVSFQVTGSGLSLLFAASMNLFFVLITVYLILRYRKEKQKTKN
jgi:uncharacterized protein with PQ loop repeat